MSKSSIIEDITDTLEDLNRHIKRAKKAGIYMGFHVQLGDRFSTFDTDHKKVILTLESATTKLYERKRK